MLPLSDLFFSDFIFGLVFVEERSQLEISGVFLLWSLDFGIHFLQYRFVNIGRLFCSIRHLSGSEEPDNLLVDDGDDLLLAFLVNRVTNGARDLNDEGNLFSEVHQLVDGSDNL